MPETLQTLPDNWADPVLTAAQAQSLLNKPHHVLFTHGGGHLLASLPPGMPADILTLYVPESQRRRGHARTLMAALVGAAEQAGCTALTLEVNAANTAAMALYRSLGLAQTAIRKNYYGPGQNALVLTRPLTL